MLPRALYARAARRAALAAAALLLAASPASAQAAGSLLLQVTSADARNVPPEYGGSKAIRGVVFIWTREG